MKIAWVSIFFIVLIWSAIAPEDYFTWFLEVLPALIGLVVLALTYKNFKLTGLTYALILIHCVILMVGGHYTYAKVPLFDWIKEPFDLSRKNYDKVGHFPQGFIPAMIAREIFIRKKVIVLEWASWKDSQELDACSKHVLYPLCCLMGRGW